MEDEVKLVMYAIQCGHQAPGSIIYFLNRLLYDKFQDDPPSTLGINFKIKRIELEDKTKIRLQIFYEYSGELIRVNVFKVHTFFFVYDISNRESFENTIVAMNKCKDKIPYGTPLFLIGNKIDLEYMRVVKKEEGKCIARRFGAKFKEVSAKNGINTHEILIEMVKTSYQNRDLF